MEREIKQRGYFVDFLPIGDAKLKIVLTPEDMRKYKIETSSGEMRDEGGRRGLWQILDKARESVGFDPSGEKILIQFYPTRDGGSEIFVTKLGILPESSARLVARSERVTMLSRKRYCYLFEDLSGLVTACKEIRRKCPRFLPIADAYYDGADFYLAIYEETSRGESSEFPFLTEFGTETTRERCEYLTEHGEVLVKKDAVKIFSEPELEF